MKYKEYTNQFWKEIDQALELAISKNPPGQPLIAAFDADGTLWDTDLGENFFNYIIDNNLVSLPEDPWEHYTNLKLKNPNLGYLWLAQICKGKQFSEVQTWAEAAVKTLHPVPVFKDQQKLIQKLIDKNFQMYVITASVAWAVQPGMQLLGLKPENVIGVETQVQGGIITDIQASPITYREGKVEGLTQKTKGLKPLFAAGNTEGDLALLESAQVRLAVSAASIDDRLHKTELILQKIAQEKNWFHHRFIISE